MSGPDTKELEQRLRSFQAPGEGDAAERSLAVVRAAIPTGPRAPSPRRTRLRLGLAAAGAIFVAIGLTPAGATVRDWIGDRIDGAEKARPALTRLPGGGRVLAGSQGGGAWVIDQDGSRRRLGSYGQAGWSPQGQNVVAVRGRQLVAMSPVGEVRWSIPRPDRIADPAWSPSGVRIAYRTGGDLRIVWGNGINDDLLASDVSPVMPAWRPPPLGVTPALDVLAYVDGTGRVVVRDVPTGQRLWSARGPSNPSAVAWLSHTRLVAAGDAGLIVFGEGGRTLLTIPNPPGTSLDDLATSIETQRIAVARSRSAGSPNELTGLGESAELVSIRIESGEPHSRTLFAGPGRFSGLTFSPDGDWILTGWRDADQWLFLRPAANRKLLRHVVAVGDISRQFDPGGSGRAAFPRIEGWCCQSR